MTRTLPLYALFMRRVDKQENGCWYWTGTKDRLGYGRVHDARDHCQRLAHRIGYELFKGPIPEGLMLDHLCRNPSCVNPDHLEAVDAFTNQARGETLTARNLAKTHCPHGHPYSGENLMIKKDGTRACRTCKNVPRRHPEGAIVPTKLAV